jgi:membrane-associated protein
MCARGSAHVLEAVDELVRYLDGALDEPVFWVTVFVVVALDALVPFMPSGTTITVAGVFASSGRLALPSLIVVAAAAAFTGDTIVYAIGRRAGPRLLARVDRRARGKRLHAWLGTAMSGRTAQLIILGRYIPGARLVVMLSAGALRCPPARFVPIDALAATLWAGTAALVGYLGGLAFVHQPPFAIGSALLAGTVLALLVRHTARRGARLP